MKGRGGGGRAGNGGNPTDLLVCFPSRAHLTLMPKPICSPSRPSTEPSKRHHQRPRGQASPLFRTKPSKPNTSDISEPTSPKVTCAGQIKVRPKPTSTSSSCKNWQSVMEEIEKLHNSNHRKSKKKPTWLDSLGLKKDIMQFLTALRSLRFDLRCFGSFHGSVVGSDISSDEEEDEEDEGQEERESSPSRTIFSKWFMVLQENQSHGPGKEIGGGAEERGESADGPDDPVAPPSNALLLMRCRSAPAKGWLGGERGGGGEERKAKEEEESARTILEEEKEKEKLVLMSYAPDFFKVSSDIARETWVVGRRDPFSRSRSWKR
ncbi:uncharacterized protein LOC131233138 [Magnolia sinica]|uniref:uncharacterized protein LOC131233138 n=1 Tax=Magnolia sinica TaxID=86752 RepID=UPI002658BED0|nr:uncharacterized protein LOC131233138 [Magnolia sinica]